MGSLRENTREKVEVFSISVNLFRTRKCKDCGRDIFLLSDQNGKVRCKTCQYKAERERQNRVKKDMKLSVKNALHNIKSQGCCLCGYNKCTWAIEMHHLFGDKGTTISKIRTLPGLVKEFNSHPIVSLCANCHRELHAGLISDNDLVTKTIEVSI